MIKKIIKSHSLIHHLLDQLWHSDPGYFHLKQACKTLLALFIVLAIVHNEPLYICATAGIITGFGMQGIVAKSFKTRFLQILMLDLAYFAVFMLGVSVHHHNYASAGVLILLGFLVNYLRQFGLQTSPAPFMGWCLCFFGTILPLPNINEVWYHAWALGIALLISGLINLFIFPKNSVHLFAGNSTQLFKLLSRGLQQLQRFKLTIPFTKDFSHLPFVKLQQQLTRLLINNQALVENLSATKAINVFNERLLQQHALVHSYALIADAYRILCLHQHVLPPKLESELQKLYVQYAIFFAKIRMRDDLSIALLSQKIRLPNSDAIFNHIPLTESRVVLVLLNLKLSFNLLNQQLTKLLDDANAT